MSNSAPAPTRRRAGADAVVLVTEWDALRALDLERLAASMRGKVLVDLRNIYPPEEVEEAGLAWYGIGRAPRPDACDGRSNMIDAFCALLQAAAAGCRPLDPSGVGDHRDSTAPTAALAARAMVWPGRLGIEVRVQAAGLAPGHYGVASPRGRPLRGPGLRQRRAALEPDRAASTASSIPQGHHLGDLDNLDVDESGAGRLEFRIPGAADRRRRGLLDADGAAVVIHAAPDDYRTDPSGNSGARIACGVLPPAH